MRMGVWKMTLVITCLVVSCWAEWFYIYDCTYNMSYGKCNKASRKVRVQYNLFDPLNHDHCKAKLRKKAKCSAKRVKTCVYKLELSPCVSNSTVDRYTPNRRRGACSRSFKLKLSCRVCSLTCHGGDHLLKETTCHGDHFRSSPLHHFFPFLFTLLMATTSSTT